ncbi:MAG: DEAD/DEAH box helicase family protein, partial [Anaerolineae bacterium]|nr:DEAD/DEAH box helicase family protein [Anaerolineae bacterium]
MHQAYVALDLETTGLDPRRDAIMEVGVVRFRVSLGNDTVQSQVIDSWSTFVNPGRPVPIQIQQLTGITSDQVMRAPRFGQVASQLRRFVSDLPVVGHSISMDLGFLRQNDFPLSNPAIDTFELAGILVPHAARYSLVKLGEKLGLPNLCTHRALEDALATKELFVALLEYAARLPAPILREINRLAGVGIDWPLRPVFCGVEEGQARSAFRGSIGQQLAAFRTEDDPDDLLGPLFAVAETEAEELVPVKTPRALDVEALTAMFEPDGLLAHGLAGFEYRPQQVEMLQVVANALNRRQHLLVEAGTGTGKSLAYLLPAATFAYLNGERVVISTNTINLQDQLFKKDIPDLQKLLPFEFRAAVLKGRSNYLCQRRLQALRQAGVRSPDEMRMLARVLVWLPSTQTGERDELFMPDPAEQALWSKISADSDTCTLDRCRFRERGRCFFYRARRAAEAAHLVVVNHALLLSDVAVDRYGGHVLPEYRYLIVDEAHHLEAAITRQLSFEADQRAVERILNDLARPVGVRRYAGFLGEVLTRCRGAIPAEQWAILEDHVGRLQRQIESALTQLYAFFNVLGEFLQEHGQKRGNYDQRLRLTSSLRIQPAWSDVEMAWDNLSAQLVRVAGDLEKLCGGLTELDELTEIPARGGVADLDGLVQDCAGYLARLQEDREQMNACIAEPDRAQIYWANVSSDDQRVALHAAPLHVGGLVEKHLFHAKESIILTSATLATDGSFDFIRGRLSAVEADELAVGSPFDFKSSTLVYLPTDIPEPNQPYYQKTVEEALAALCRATEGRTLVLFTSYSQLRATSQAISRALSEADISVYEQGAGVSRVQLLENFRTVPRSVLLGTRSFWEGIDVVGPALSVLVIVRLPFAVPDDPIFSARSDTFDNPFAEYAVPEAILRFRQGFGRLIRTKTDRGVVVILDKRVLTKSYGPMFLNSLPECTQVRGTLVKLPDAARRWLA